MTRLLRQAFLLALEATPFEPQAPAASGLRATEPWAAVVIADGDVAKRKETFAQ